MMNNLNLYLIERTDPVGWDEYDAFVIAATSEQEAIGMVNWCALPDCDPVCRLIGIASSEVEPGVVLGSFNAG